MGKLGSVTRKNGAGWTGVYISKKGVNNQNTGGEKSEEEYITHYVGGGYEN